MKTRVDRVRQRGDDLGFGLVPVAFNSEAGGVAVAAAAEFLGYFCYVDVPFGTQARTEFARPDLAKINSGDHVTSGERHIYKAIIVAVDRQRSLAHFKRLPHDGDPARIVPVNGG